MNPKLSVRLQSDSPGIIEAGAPSDPHILIHVGPPVEIECERDGHRHRGTSIHGDLDIIPAGVASRWVLKKPDSALIVRVSQDLLNAVAEDSGVDPFKVKVLNRFQIRDPQIEQLGWALKTEMEDGHGSGKLYLDSLGTALASRLLYSHSSFARKPAQVFSGGMSGSRLRQVLSFIEDNLSDGLSLEEIASVSSLSVSHCQRAFRNMVGTSIHQYVIRRRVQRAEALLSEGKLSIREIALEVGFAHPSHLASHTRRLLGHSPRSLKKLNRKTAINDPNLLVSV